MKIPKNIFDKLSKDLQNTRLIDIRIMIKIWNYLRKHDSINECKKYNYPQEISKKTSVSPPSVYKVIEIFEKMDLIERRSNGRKNVIHLKVSKK